MCAVVITISGVLPPTSIMTVVSLAAEVVVEVSAEVEEHGVSGVDSPDLRGDLRGGLHVGHLGLDSLDSLDSWLHVGGGWHNRVVTLGSSHGINKLGCKVLGISLSIPLLTTLILARVGVLVSELVGVSAARLVGLKPLPIGAPLHTIFAQGSGAS